MATANESVVARAYEAFGTGDLDAIRNECFTADMRWVGPGTSPFMGTYTDIDGVLGFFVKLFELSGGTFKVTPESISGFSDFVVVRSRASWTGKSPHDDPYVQVFRMKDGRATECTLVVNDQQAWAEFPA